MPIHYLKLSPFLLFISLAMGCASTEQTRSDIGKLQTIEMIYVASPAMEVPSFMQAAIKSHALGGLIPGLIENAEKKYTLKPPLIQDFSQLITQKLQLQLKQIPWWPEIITHQSPVPTNYSFPSGHWLRVELIDYEIAPSPLKTIYAKVRVSLERPYKQGSPLWLKSEIYSGFVHGGEKIVMDKLPNDPSQLRQEIDRAAEWLAKEIASDFQ